tara:strand:+ start:108908 stop:109093 length:186 start_codon:yes stop_codon:yes gene_type:complete
MHYINFIHPLIPLAWPNILEYIGRKHFNIRYLNKILLSKENPPHPEGLVNIKYLGHNKWCL